MWKTSEFHTRDFKFFLFNLMNATSDDNDGPSSPVQNFLSSGNSNLQGVSGIAPQFGPFLTNGRPYNVCFFFLVHISTSSQFPQMHHSLDASHFFPQHYNIAKMLSEEDLCSGGNKAYLKLEKENCRLRDQLDDLQCVFHSFITHISSSTIIHRTKLIATLNVDSRHTPLTPGSIHSGIH